MNFVCRQKKPKIRVEFCVKYMACQIDLPHLREGGRAQLDRAPAVINDQVAATRIYGNFMDAVIATLGHSQLLPHSDTAAVIATLGHSKLLPHSDTAS